MKINVLDAMTLVSNAVCAELGAMELGTILADRGTVTIKRAVDGWPCEAVWCEITVQAGGVVQPLRIEVTVDNGRMVGDHNPVIRAMVDGAVRFAARHEVLSIQHHQLRIDIEAVIAEAAAEGLQIELLAIDRLPLDLQDAVSSDSWQVRLMMLDMLGDRVSMEEIRVPVHTLEAHLFGAKLRSHWIPEQRVFQQRAAAGSAAA